MRIVNRTKGTILADQGREARSLGERIRGLLGQQSLPDGHGLYISPCTSIHSFFMRFVFDAAFVDARGRVLHVIQRMRPWRMSRLVPRAEGVIELPAGVLAKTGTEPGDSVVFEEVPDDPQP